MKNLGLKIGSVVFAAFFWVIVTNLEDPVDSRNYDNIPVRIVNTYLLDESNRVYEVLENTDIIDRVTVRAPRSIISTITNNNIVARADIADLSSLDTVSITLTVDNVNPSDINTISGTSNILKLNIEDRRTRNLMVRATATGEIVEGYMQGDISVDPNSVTISGPESLVSTVSYAEAGVDITGFTSDISTTADIILYDINGHRISTDRISQNEGSASVRIQILEVESIPIRFDISGTPAPGYRRNGVVEISSNEILVAGPASVFRTLDAIRIPGEITDVEGATETLVVNVDLNTYLPNNVRLVNPSDNMLRILVGVEEEVTSSITLSPSQLRVQNMPAGFYASFDDFEESSAFTLVGLQSDIDAVNPAELYGYLDIAAWMDDRNILQLSAGNYQIPVSLTPGPDIAVTNTVLVLTHILEYEE